ncbi:hypothetical protein ACLIYM_05385 [Streptomyces fenghuangensis]|uniref:SMI1/KNR4 family protein n=1 Tax=Streptomyces chitinivorans TaxID=1257027 RepID=A0ABW7I0E7_9ACTN|nr:hypothetical protein [Streptomyces chitinivorans]MDH2408938.1 hypothetical protein [Streptomyces chitinivorans]
MSWDVLLLSIPAGFDSVSDLPRDYSPAPVGDGARVRQALRTAVPEVELDDPSWGVLTGPTWSIELNIGDEDPVESVMLHLHGGGDDVLPVVFRIATALGCRPVDCSNGEFLAEGDTGGWHAFQAFRDRVAAPGR